MCVCVLTLVLKLVLESWNDRVQIKSGFGVSGLRS